MEKRSGCYQLAVKKNRRRKISTCFVSTVWTVYRSNSLHINIKAQRINLSAALCAYRVP